MRGLQDARVRVCAKNQKRREEINTENTEEEHRGHGEERQGLPSAKGEEAEIAGIVLGAKIAGSEESKRLNWNEIFR
jgi:hypothetical protein